MMLFVEGLVDSADRRRDVVKRLQQAMRRLSADGRFIAFALIGGCKTSWSRQ